MNDSPADIAKALMEVSKKAFYDKFEAEHKAKFLYYIMMYEKILFKAEKTETEKYYLEEGRDLYEIGKEQYC